MATPPTLPHHKAATQNLRFEVAVDITIEVKGVGRQPVTAAQRTDFCVSPKCGTYSSMCEQAQTLLQFPQHPHCDPSFWTGPLFPTFGKDQWLRITCYYIYK